MKIDNDSISLKERKVKEIANSIKKAKTLMIASIKNLPSKQFQNIKKSIRQDADVRMAKKNIVIRALDYTNLLELKEYINADCVIIFSNLDSYELARILTKKKTPVFAKSGQIAEKDIEVKEGVTNLIPGPAISELGALGLQVTVQDGKIAIKTTRVVIKKGQTINENAASILQKLNIMPFNIGLNAIVAYDMANKKVFNELKIEPERYITELKTASNKAIGFARKIIYVCGETISYLLIKANNDANVLRNIQLNKLEESV